MVTNATFICTFTVKFKITVFSFSICKKKKKNSVMTKPNFQHHCQSAMSPMLPFCNVILQKSFKYIDLTTKSLLE